jgi:hypothetical protein
MFNIGDPRIVSLVGNAERENSLFAIRTNDLEAPEKASKTSSEGQAGESPGPNANLYIISPVLISRA